MHIFIVFRATSHFEQHICLFSSQFEQERICMFSSCFEKHHILSKTFVNFNHVLNNNLFRTTHLHIFIRFRATTWFEKKIHILSCFKQQHIYEQHIGIFSSCFELHHILNSTFPHLYRVSSNNPFRTIYLHVFIVLRATTYFE